MDAPLPRLRLTLRRWHRRAAHALGVIALASAAAAAQAPDPAAFDRLLRGHVKSGQVDYPVFQGDAGFAAFVAGLARPAELRTRNEQLAYNINAYNALAIQGIVEGLSPASFLGRQRYFKLQEWPLDGRLISLHDLEHRVLRPLAEPRIHFAIVCASRSCPVLRREAFRPEALDSQLDEQARAFINDPSRNRFDAASRTADLSEIFKWFEADFRIAGSLQRYLAKYVADADAARLLASDGFRIRWIDYDWTLNGTPPRSR